MATTIRTAFHATTRLGRAEARWERLLQILEEMGYAREYTWDDAVQAARHGRRVYWTRHHWLGVGSSYVTVLDADTRITVRMSDHAQRPGGGRRYSAVLDDYDRAGEADVSIHPGSGVTLRNVRRHIEAVLERARREEEDEAPASYRYERYPDAGPRYGSAEWHQANFRRRWQELRAQLGPEAWQRWQQLGGDREAARALAKELGVGPGRLYAALTGGEEW